MPSKLTKIELVEIIKADEDIAGYGLNEKEVHAVITAFLDKFRGQIETLAPGDRIELRGLGTFYVKKSKLKTARNPKTGLPVQVPARKKLHFKPGREMLEKVRGETPASGPVMDKSGL